MPRLSHRQRRALRRAAERLGVEPVARRVWELGNPAARRDRLDNERLRLLFAFASRPDWSCVDVGAHSGAILREIVAWCPAGRHVAFEPLPAQCALLRREFPAVDVRETALWNTDGEHSFVHVLEEPWMSGLRRRTYAQEGARTEEIAVRTARLDDALPDGFAPDFLKVDVEGAEREVFEGGLETIRRHRPVIWFEHGRGGADHYGARPEDVHALLAGQAGLRIFDVDGVGPLSKSDFAARFDGPAWTYVARP